MSGLKIQDKKMAPDVTRGSVMSFDMTFAVSVQVLSVYVELVSQWDS